MELKYLIKLHWKKIVGLLILLAMGSLILVSKLLSIEWLNDYVVYAAEACMALGFISYFELKDITIWWKRWSIRKYKTGDKYILEYKYYNKNLKLNITTTDVIIEEILTNNVRGIIHVLACNDYKLYTRINPLTGGITIVAPNNEEYKPTKYQYYFNIKSSMDDLVNNFFQICTPNNDYCSLEVNSLKIIKK